jgi:hypothetical protein
MSEKNLCSEEEMQAAFQKASECCSKLIKSCSEAALYALAIKQYKDWPLYVKDAAVAVSLAIAWAGARMDFINPIDDLEETQSIKKALSALREANKFLSPFSEDSSWQHP